MLDFAAMHLIWIILSLCPKEITPSVNSSRAVPLALNAHLPTSAKNYTGHNTQSANSIRIRPPDMMYSSTSEKSTDMKLK